MSPQIVKCRRCGGKAQVFKENDSFNKAGCLEKNCYWTYTILAIDMEEFMAENKYIDVSEGKEIP